MEEYFLILLFFFLLILFFLAFISSVNDGVKRVFEHTKLVEVPSYPVIISLTTSPTRLSHCIENLNRMIDANTFPAGAEIHLNLPLRFKRTGETYPQIINPCPHSRIQIFRGLKDEGPATKLLPTLERVRASHNLSRLIITIDDDDLYNENFFRLHLQLAQLYDYKVVTCFSDQDIFITPMLPYFHGIRKILSQRMITLPLKPSPIEHRFTCLVEGFASVGYPAQLVNPSIIRSYLQQSEKCRNSDDLLISLALHDLKIPIIRIGNLLMPTQINCLDYGFERDALHKIQSHHKQYYYCLTKELKLNPKND